MLHRLPSRRTLPQVQGEGDVFWFWGHTQDLGYDDAIWARLEGIIKRISEDPDAEWIDVGDLAKENKEGAEQRTMCNPLPIEDYPLGVHCRGLANGTVPQVVDFAPFGE